MFNIKVLAEPTEETKINTYLKDDIVLAEYQIKRGQLIFNADGVLSSQIDIFTSNDEEIKDFFYDTSLKIIDKNKGIFIEKDDFTFYIQAEHIKINFWKGKTNKLDTKLFDMFKKVKNLILK